MRKLVMILCTLAISSIGAVAFNRLPPALAEHNHPELEATSRYERFKTYHGGGLDANGGHKDNKTGTYHYHRKK